MIRRPPRSTQSRSSAASDVYKRQVAGPRLASLRDRTRSRGRSSRHIHTSATHHTVRGFRSPFSAPPERYSSTQNLLKILGDAVRPKEVGRKRSTLVRSRPRPEPESEPRPEPASSGAEAKHKLARPRSPTGTSVLRGRSKAQARSSRKPDWWERPASSEAEAKHKLARPGSPTGRLRSRQRAHV